MKKKKKLMLSILIALISLFLGIAINLFSNELLSIFNNNSEILQFTDTSFGVLTTIIAVIMFLSRPSKKNGSKNGEH